MSDSPIFEFVCERVESEAKLTRLEARGTVRLLLKEVGLDAQQVGKGPAMLAIDRFLEQALRVRRVAEPDKVKIGSCRHCGRARSRAPRAKTPRRSSAASR